MGKQMNESARNESESSGQRRPEPRADAAVASRRRRRGRGVAAVLTLLAVGVGGGAFAQAAVTAVKPESNLVAIEDASFAWEMNNESGNGAFMPGSCNFLVAGKVPDPGRGSQQIDEAAYDTARQNGAGNVRVTRPSADRKTRVDSTFADRCQSANGTKLVSGVHKDDGDYSHNRIEISGGTGSVDWRTGAGTIQWHGAWTVAYYNGLTFWYAADPKLTVNADGSAKITATGSGFASSMEDMTQWRPVEPREITLATFDKAKGRAALAEGALRRADTTDQEAVGFDILPDYEGVRVKDDSGTVLNETGNPQGSFPQDFVSFQQATGQGAYWYSSNGAADANKVAAPVTVRYGNAPVTQQVTVNSVTGGDGGNSAAQPAPAPAADSQPQTATAPRRTEALGTDSAPAAASALAATPAQLQTIDDLTAAIQDGRVQQIEGTEAGLADSFAWGDQLALGFAWPEDDAEATGGTVMAYPGAQYVGGFAVTDGQVRLVVDSSALPQGDDGDRYFVFFGNTGKTIAVHTMQRGTAAQASAQQPEAEEQAAAPEQRSGDSLWTTLLIVAGGVIVIAGGASLLLLRRGGRR
ncbi:hypothetical protein [Pseudoclavibacter sp. 13-3]|uniref:hypothetical protein n=1 Tax=Pseudoclavibacter sp. 13-3 TaxID=2901228 RepID=UPI001E55AF9B|nr:hypothetical protein [Pseudoclavibacter sp. 13-3]MCD7100992.1 hypothetical protein [Pseudoclavibacter sp. 13-3]